MKFTRDGSRIDKYLHVLNFAFTILDEWAMAYHCIAIAKELESYEEIIIMDVQTVTALTINETTYSMEYYLGGDWKFLQWSLELTVHHVNTHVFGASVRHWNNTLQMRSGQYL